MLRYIARQPILDTRQQTFGYELLYRAGAENFARIGDPEEAARRTLDDLLTLGVQELSRGRHVFLNCTHDLLAHGLVKLLAMRQHIGDDRVANRTAGIARG